MFQENSSLITLDLSSFKTDNVTCMVYIFSNCSSLTKLNISNFAVISEKMNGMFSGCSSLKELICSEQFKKNVIIEFPNIQLQLI